MKTLKIGRLNIHRIINSDNRRYYFINFTGSDRFIHLRPYWIDKAWERLRRLLPYFHAVGLQDCDSGGRVHVWYPVFAWNYWHQKKVARAWYGAGDGEIWKALTPLAWARWKIRLYRQGRDC